MDISLDSLFEHSFVISVNDERLNIFKRRFLEEGLPVPRVFTGF